MANQLTDLLKSAVLAYRKRTDAQTQLRTLKARVDEAQTTFSKADRDFLQAVFALLEHVPRLFPDMFRDSKQ